MEAYAIINQETSTVAQKLVDEFFCRLLHLNTQLFSVIYKLVKIQKPHNTLSPGLVEQFNQTLLDMLATTTQNHPLDWKDHI